ncbi:hypothetical protein ACP4OV_007358 [Aristida adscensionis]
MATPVSRILPQPEATESPRQPPALTDDVLEEILLRVASPTDLARASAACATFRRIAADPAFLRRYRSLHPPLLLGVLNSRPPLGFDPVEADYPNAPAARALAAAADFSFEFVPLTGQRRWRIADVRRGRVLLMSSDAVRPDGFLSRDLAVCNPLSRQYLLLPPIPGDLLASVQAQVSKGNIQYFEAFLAPNGEEDETSFRVIGRTHCEANSVVFVFSSGSRLWSVGTSTSWGALSLSVLSYPTLYHLIYASYAYGCFYWKVKLKNKLLKLDISMMEFSAVELPPDHDVKDVIIVEAGEGRTGMLSLINSRRCVRYSIQQNKGQNANEWQVENTIRLPIRYDFSFVGAAEEYVILLGDQVDVVDEEEHLVDTIVFSLHIKTSKIERVGWTDSYDIRGAYFGFPPSMSRRIM